MLNKKFGMPPSARCSVIAGTNLTEGPLCADTMSLKLHSKACANDLVKAASLSREFFLALKRGVAVINDPGFSISSSATAQPSTTPAPQNSQSQTGEVLFKFNPIIPDQFSVNLNDRSKWLIGQSLATSTWKRYTSYLKVFFEYCDSRGVNHNDPPSAERALDFVCYLHFEKKVKFSSALQVIAAVKKFFSLNGKVCAIFDDGVVKAALEGMRNNEAQCHVAQRAGHRLVIPFSALQVLGHVVSDLPWPASDKHTFWSLCLVLYYGAFRGGDILSSRATVLTSKTLTWAQIKFPSPDRVVVFIRTPKASDDPRGLTRTLVKGRDDRYCPVKWLNIIKPTPINPSQPVFAFKSKKLITPAMVNKILALLSEKIQPPDGAKYTCHSFRAALPTLMASQPNIFSEREILNSGGWKSNAVDRYIRQSGATAVATAKKIQNV